MRLLSFFFVAVLLIVAVRASGIGEVRTQSNKDTLETRVEKLEREQRIMLLTLNVHNNTLDKLADRMNALSGGGIGVTYRGMPVQELDCDPSLHCSYWTNHLNIGVEENEGQHMKLDCITPKGDYQLLWGFKAKTCEELGEGWKTVVLPTSAVVTIEPKE